MITHKVDLHEYLSDNIYDYPLVSMGKVSPNSSVADPGCFIPDPDP
jgi:hypothetical protein